MTTAADAKFRPGADAGHREPSKHRRRGIVLALVGLVIALAAFVGNLIAAAQTGDARAANLAWSFGLTTTGFAIIKTAIAVVLWGILAKLWLRADSIKSSLPALVGTPRENDSQSGEMDTPTARSR